MIICLDQRMGKDAQLAVASSFTFDREAVVFPTIFEKKREAPFVKVTGFLYEERDWDSQQLF